MVLHALGKVRLTEARGSVGETEWVEGWQYRWEEMWPGRGREWNEGGISLGARSVEESRTEKKELVKGLRGERTNIWH